MSVGILRIRKSKLHTWKNHIATTRDGGDIIAPHRNEVNLLKSEVGKPGLSRVFQNALKAR